MKLLDLPLDEAQALESPALDSPWLVQRLSWGAVLRSPPLAEGKNMDACVAALAWPFRPGVLPGQRLTLGDAQQLHMEVCVTGTDLSGTVQAALEDAVAQYLALKRGFQEAAFETEGGDAPADATPVVDLLDQLTLTLAQDEELAAAILVDEPVGTLVIQDPNDQWLACVSPAPQADALSMTLTLADLSDSSDEAAAHCVKRALSLNAAAGLGPQVQMALDIDSGQLLLLSPLGVDGAEGAEDAPVGPKEVKVSLGRLLMLREALRAELEPAADAPRESAAGTWMLRG